jgi:transposase-like protein
VDFHDETTSAHLLDEGNACREWVLAFLLSLGLQLTHTETCNGGGWLTRHSHDLRVRLGGMTIWRIPCTRCKAVFTVLPHVVLRYRSRRPDMARNALWATPGGLSGELWAVICPLSPMALYRLLGALGHHRLVTVLTPAVVSRGLPLSWPMQSTAMASETECICPRLAVVVSSGTSATPRPPAPRLLPSLIQSFILLPIKIGGSGTEYTGADTKGGSAMQRRKWDAKTKAMIVLEGLKGKPVAELCNEHQLSQAQYYQWRDQFLAHAAKAFEVHEQSQREARLTQENARLKTLVGELTLELKKSAEVFG